MKFLLILLLFGCITLTILKIVNTICFNKSRKNIKKKTYRIPKLSELHGKEFSDYIDYLTRDL